VILIKNIYTLWGRRSWSRIYILYGVGDPDQEYIYFMGSERTDKRTWLDRLFKWCNKNIYFMGSETLSSACYILSDESSIPLNSKSNGYKNVTEEKWKREDKPRAVLHVPYRKKPSAFVSLFVKKCVLELFFSKCVPEVLFGNASGCTMLKHIQTAERVVLCKKNAT